MRICQIYNVDIITTTPFIVAAAFYLVMTLVLTWGFQRLEQRYAKYDQ